MSTTPIEPEPIPPPEAPQGSRFRHAHWLPRDAALGVVIALLLAGTVLLGNVDILKRVHSAVLMIAGLVVELGILLALPLWLLRKRSDPIGVAPRPASRFVTEFIIAMPLACGVFFASTAAVLAARYILTRIGHPAESALDFWGQTAYGRMIPLVILAVFVAPVVEEVFFRGFLYNSLRSVFAPSLAACLQALLFSLGHLYEPLGVVATFVIGLLLAAIYEWRKTLLTGIFVHGMFNGIGMLAIAAAVMLTAKAPMIGTAFDPEHPGQVVVKEVIPGSPAEQADIRPGDVIVKYEGQEVTDDKQLTRFVREGMVGDKVSLEIVRGDRTMTKRVVLRSCADVEQ